MPLNLDNITQLQPIKTGSFDGTSGTAVLDLPTSPGTAVMVAVGLSGDDVTAFSATVTGLTAFTQGVGANRVKTYLFYKPSGAGGETSFTINVTPSGSLVTWAAWEMDGLDLSTDVSELGAPVAGMHMWATAPLNPDAATVSTLTLPASEFLGDSGAVSTSSYETAGFMLFAGTSPDTNVPVFSGYTDGFEELVQVSGANATRAIALAVAIKFSTGLYEPNCTVSVSPNAYCKGTGVYFSAAGAKYASNFAAISGAEQGSAVTLTNAPPTPTWGTKLRPFDVVLGAPAINSTTPRSGTYCWELSSSAATEALAWNDAASGGRLDNTLPGGAPHLVSRFHVYFPTSLPSTDVELASADAGGTTVFVRYRTASQKIGVQIGTDAEQLSDAVVAADKWIGIDIGYYSGLTTHTCDWQVDYDSLDAVDAVPQIQATGAGSVGNTTIFRFGWHVARTATVRFDDISVARRRYAYPIGDQRILPIKVNNSDDLPTVSGTAGNFRVFTADGGTLTAFSGAGAAAALDDIPAVIGASADGVCQTANDTGSYINIPFETFQGAPDYVLSCLQIWAAGWAASGTAATVGYRHVVDGEEIVIGANTVDPTFDNASTVWVCRMYKHLDVTFYRLTQARLNSSAVRVGWSGDAAPDIGLHNVLGELCVFPVKIVHLFGDPEGLPRVVAGTNGLSGSIIAIHCYTDVGQTGTLTWWDADDVPHATAVLASSNPQTIIVAADEIEGSPQIEWLLDE